MEEVRKFRKEHSASCWKLAQMIDIPVVSYVRFEGMKESRLPKQILNKFNDLITRGDEVDKYYRDMEVFYLNNDLEHIFQSHNVTHDDVAAEVGVGIDTIEEIAHGAPFPTADVRDMITDYAYRLVHSNEKDVQCPQETCEIPTMVSNLTEHIERADEIDGLHRQIDWYEDIIDAFISISKMINNE